jgi:hypothetical protein
MRQAPHQRPGDPAVRVARVDGRGRPPERDGGQDAPASHQEERRRHRGGLRPAWRHQEGRQTAQQESQHRLARPVIPALPERLGAEPLGMLRGHTRHERRQRRPGGRREGEAARKEQMEQRGRLAPVLGVDPDEVRPQVGQLARLRWCQRKRVGREDLADRMHVKPIHDALSRAGRRAGLTAVGAAACGAPLPAAPLKCDPEGGGCQPVALARVWGVW